MTRGDIYPQPEHFGDASVPAFGYELIRNELIPELLGEETASILYWSGRKIARHYPLDNEEQLADFFTQAGWGTLTMLEKGKSKITFDCRSALIESRIKDHPESVSFALEAGFIAEQMQRILGFMAESYTDIRKGREKKALFTVKWDAKDPIDRNTEPATRTARKKMKNDTLGSF
ncbi:MULTISPECIES: YslB family protein [unclassified Sporolactobacillus]|uniref:YslB family protein n=1 Tax=unclassified Sporolactobacillus TaxID=2628533 RepID=UPI002367714D|nr:YslB family protein [Sporolactobacillus sp. CQH2019]MDD9147873.1 YslB family protein [Sporolactobacillus sp. CQH2019]